MWFGADQVSSACSIGVFGNQVSILEVILNLKTMHVCISELFTIFILRSSQRICCYFQVGVAVGFVLPPMLVSNSDKMDEIGHDLQWMFIYIASYVTVIFILMLICMVISHCENIFDTVFV